MPTANHTARVLILSDQPLLAALVGIMVESGSLEPAFAEAGERPEDAITRVRPLLVILLDVEMEAAGSDLFFARAARRGVPVLLFTAPGRAVDVESVAAAREVRWLSLPVDAAALVGAIAEATGDARRGTERRRRSSISRIIDGTLVFEDREGRRWHVYDRRGGERRGPTPGELGAPDGMSAYRAFVNEAGEEWRFPFAAGVVPSVTAPDLERQLAAASRVTPSGD